MYQQLQQTTARLASPFRDFVYRPASRILNSREYRPRERRRTQMKRYSLPLIVASLMIAVLSSPTVAFACSKIILGT